MKKWSFLFFVAVLFTACSDTTNTGNDFIAPLPESVYIAGSCNDELGGLKQQACYWVGKRRIVLNGYWADFITISDNELLITGSFLKLIPDGNMDGGIFIEDVKSGKIYKVIDCYWLGKNRHEGRYEAIKDKNEIDDYNAGLPENSRVLDYTMAGGKLWMAGYYQRGDKTVACYWVDGQRYDLNGSAATAIFVEE